MLPNRSTPLSISRRRFVAALGAGGALLASGGLGGCASARRNPTPATYTNPVYAGSMPDPGVLLHEGMYYAFGTTGAERKSDGRIFTLLRSADLVHWDERRGALTPPTGAAPTDQFWAPEAAYHDGRFYLYYTHGRADGRFVVRVAESRAPEGPYTDAAVLQDWQDNPFAIDAHPYQDDDGAWYLFYARDYPDTEGGAFAGTAIAVDRLASMTRLAGEGRTLLRARHPWTLFEANRRMDAYGGVFDWHTLEAPWIRKHGGKYYLFYSGSNWQSEHYGVDYAVADHVLGPYTGQGDAARILRGEPGRVRGPGHHSVVAGRDGADYVVYHAWDAQMQVRQMCIDRLLWTPSGPRLAHGPTTTPQPAP